MSASQAHCADVLLHHYAAGRPGRVACVVGGSVDMRYLRRKLGRKLRALDVRIEVYHSELLVDDSIIRPSRLLLLITEMLYAKDWNRVRRSLECVFDMCECHRIRQGLVVSTRDYGWCDVLETLPITQSMERRRHCIALEDPHVYRALTLTHLPRENGNEMPWWQRHWHAPHDFIGFPLPDIFPIHQRLRTLLQGTRSPRDPGAYDWRDARLSFNSLPLGNLLTESFSHRLADGQRMAVLLLVCAVQLTSGAAFAPVFQSTRHLVSDRDRLWRLLETGCFLRGFLCSAGQTSVEVGLAAMAFQNVGTMDGIEVGALQTLDGFQFRELCASLPRRVSSAMTLVLEEVMWVMKLYLEKVLQSLAEWPWAPRGVNAPAIQRVARLPAVSVRQVAAFLGEISCTAAAVRAWGKDAPSGFVFEINPLQEDLIGFKCTPPVLCKDPEHGYTIQDASSLYRLEEVLRAYGCRTWWGDLISGRSSEYVLVGALDVYFHLAEYDEQTDEIDAGDEAHELFVSKSKARPAHNNISCADDRFSVYFATRPQWLLNPATHPQTTPQKRRAVHALKRHVLPDRMYLNCTVVGPA